LTIAIYIILGLLIVTLEFRRHSSGGPIDGMTVFNCYYFVLFAFVPINVICLGADVVRQKYAYETFGEGDVYTALSLLFSYVLFCLGYWVKSSNRSESAVRCGTNYFSLRDSANVAKIIFTFGVLLTAIYVLQVGGILEVIRRANEVRSGELVIESKYIGYRHLSQFSADAFVLFFAVVIGKKVRKTNITARDKVFLLCAFVFFVYFALSTGGRRPFLYPIISCLLVYASVGGRVKKVILAAFVVIFVIAGLGSMIGAMDPVENAPALLQIARDNDANRWALLEIAYDNASQGLADSFIHFVGAQKASLWQFGFLTDIVNLPGDFFPSQLLGFKRTRHMYGQVSEYFLGHAFYDDDPYGEPLGLHGYLLVNFGYVGMFASFFLLGLLYKWIHIRFKPAVLKDAVGWLVYWWVVLAFFVYFREGVLLFVLKEQLTWWVTIILLVHYQTRQKSRPTIKSYSSICTSQVSLT
jgi:hypothetical protein